MFEVFEVDELGIWLYSRLCRCLDISKCFQLILLFVTFFISFLNKEMNLKFCRAFPAVSIQLILKSINVNTSYIVCTLFSQVIPSLLL